MRLRGLDRVLKPGGHLLVMGTSNRLAPQEVHSRRWLINYVPRCADQAIGLRNPLQRGIWPWSITDLFPLYRDLVLEDRGKGFVTAKREGGTALTKIIALNWLRMFGALVGCSIGILVPSIFLVLQKPKFSAR